MLVRINKTQSYIQKNLLNDPNGAGRVIWACSRHFHLPSCFPLASYHVFRRLEPIYV